MIRYHSVSAEKYLHYSPSIAAIEAVNQAAHDDQDVLAPVVISSESGDDVAIPMAITTPVDERHDAPMSELDGVVVRPLPMANGLRLKHHDVEAALIAQFTGKAVLSVTLPDRDWHGFTTPDETKRWHSLAGRDRDVASLAVFDQFADNAMSSIEYVVEQEDAGDDVSFMGESAAAPIALSMAHQARNSDVRAVSVSAIPNVENRGVYTELLIRDFLPSADGMSDHVAAGNPQLLPLMEAHGITGQQTQSQWDELRAGFDYLRKDLFGGLPTPANKLFVANRQIARALSRATAITQIDRLVGNGSPPVATAVHMFGEDNVAKPEKLQESARSRVRHGHTSFYGLPDLGHSACNNPYVLLYAAISLIERP